MKKSKDPKESTLYETLTILSSRLGGGLESFVSIADGLGNSFRNWLHGEQIKKKPKVLFKNGKLISVASGKEVKLTQLEIKICEKIFSEKINSKIRTIDIENLVYPHEPEKTDHIRSVKFKQAFKRLNKKVENQIRIKPFKYSANFVLRCK